MILMNLRFEHRNFMLIAHTISHYNSKFIHTYVHGEHTHRNTPYGKEGYHHIFASRYGTK